MKKYYLGCDVSKGYCDFIVLNENFKTQLKSFQLDDTFKGRKILYEVLKSKLAFGDYEILAGLESTGGYEEHWFKSLQNFYPDLNIKVAKVNPMVTFLSDKLTMEKIKTDEISAKTIASYLIRYKDEINFELVDLWSDLRKQWSFIRLITKQKSQLLNHLESLLYKYNPGMIPFFKKGISNWLVELLIKYPTPKKMKNAKIVGLAKIPYVTTVKAKELKEKVKLNFKDTPREIDYLISSIGHQIKSKEEIKKTQLRLIENQICKEDLEILMSFDGIDKISGIGLLVEIGDVKRFKTAKQIVSFFGVHPVFRMSGNKKGESHMSKMGRSEAKRILYMVALSGIRFNNDIRHFYLRKRIDGKNGMVALGACMGKVLKIIYSMLNTKTNFNSRYKKEDLHDLEEKFQSICILRNQRIVKEKYSKNRRIEEFDDNAPVSIREKVKRNILIELNEIEKKTEPNKRI